MKGYAFALSTVLRVRRVEAALEHQRVAAAARALAAALVAEQAINETYDAALSPSGDLGGSVFVATFERGGRLAQALAQATEHRKLVEARLQTVRGEAAASTARVKVLDRLDDRRRAEWTAAIQHEDAALLDDFATSRFAAGVMEAAHVD